MSNKVYVLQKDYSTPTKTCKKGVLLTLNNDNTYYMLPTDDGEPHLLLDREVVENNTEWFKLIQEPFIENHKFVIGSDPIKERLVRSENITWVEDYCLCNVGVCVRIPKEIPIELVKKIKVTSKFGYTKEDMKKCSEYFFNQAKSGKYFNTLTPFEDFLNSLNPNNSSIK